METSSVEMDVESQNGEALKWVDGVWKDSWIHFKPLVLKA